MCPYIARSAEASLLRQTHDDARVKIGFKSDFLHVTPHPPRLLGSQLRLLLEYQLALAS